MSPETKHALLIVAVAWHVGWLVFVVLFVRAQRRENPNAWLIGFPWDRVFIIGLLLWWLFLALQFKRWLSTRRTRQ